MPMVPETLIAMLACARIGAIHSVVFGGFSPDSLAGRIIDCDSNFVITANEGLRGGKILKLKKTVDVLTLTATPIPRTLHMSLSGMRDLSVIETAPVDRLAIRTYVTRFDDDPLREAILRELRRGGQVYFVHNEVSSIERAARELEELVPEAQVAIGHGGVGQLLVEIGPVGPVPPAGEGLGVDRLFAIDVGCRGYFFDQPDIAHLRPEFATQNVNGPQRFQ